MMDELDERRSLNNQKKKKEIENTCICRVGLYADYLQQSGAKIEE